MSMKKFILAICLNCIIFSVFSQITCDSAYVILKTAILNNEWEKKEIACYKTTVKPHDTIFTLDSIIVSPDFESWFFFVDELPYANWGHKCKYIFICCKSGECFIINTYMPPKNTNGFDVRNNVFSSYKTNESELFRIPYKRNVSTSNNEYAVIISGGANPAYNYARYWNDCSAIYQALVNRYGYDKNKVFVLMANGISSYYNNYTYLNPIYSLFPNDLDGDGTNDIQYAATANNISLVFDSLSHIMTPSDNLFIFVTDHGGVGSTINLWYEKITKEQFVSEVNKISFAKSINICMEQCYSGGYISALAGERRVIATACAYNETSKPMHNSNSYDEFCYHWVSAVVGETPSGTIVNADYDNNGFVSMLEAFAYAMSNDYFFLLSLNDPQHETPQYYSNPSCLGGSLVLNGVFDNTCLRNDLYIRDTVTDDGSMPSNAYKTWESPDIWVEDMNGNVVDNPQGNSVYKVCVRVNNRNDIASSGTEKLFLNWAKAGFNDQWYEYWTCDNPLPCGFGLCKGDVIGDANGISLPSIPANGSCTVKVSWNTPMAESYAGCTEFSCDQWHFCLLARIHDDDVIAHENERYADVHTLVRNHNNVAQKNVYLSTSVEYQVTIDVGNAKPINLNRIICLNPKVVSNIQITDYAEVYITLDAGLLAAINSANISGLTWVNSNTLRWNGGSASIPVTLPANSYYTLQTTIHFLADQIPATNNFDFDMVLRNAAGDSILGGEHYQCIRTNGRYFQAVAHDDMTILWGETASLYATDILETAEYKWYDDQGNEVGDGLTCNVSPQQNTNYTLRVTADADGYRAYSTVTVMVVDGELRMLAPNPADNQVRIGYALSRNVSSATLQILNGSGQVVHSQMLNGGNGSKVTGETLVNTSSLASGSYTVRLVSSNGKVHDSKTLVVR